MKITIDNPCRAKISRQVYDICIPHGVAPKGPKTAVMPDGRKFSLDPQWSIGDRTYYSGFAPFLDGESFVGNIEVVGRDRDTAPAFTLHPAVFDPDHPESIKEMVGAIVGYAGGQEVFRYTLTLGPTPDYATPQQLRWHGYQKSQSPWRVDFWITVSHASPEVPIEVLVTCDDNGEEAEFPLDYVVLTWGEEIRTRYEVAHGLVVGTNSLSWFNKEGLESRCTAPIQLLGTLICRSANPADNDEAYLEKLRFGKSRGMLMPDSLDGHLPTHGSVAKWEGSLRYWIEENQHYLETAPVPEWSGWHARPKYGGRSDPNVGGDDPGFGLISHAGLYGERETGRSILLLDRILSDGCRGSGLRNHNHLVDGEPWMWSYRCDVATWEDKPDKRFTNTHPNLLGGPLPKYTVHGFRTRDSQHSIDPLAQIAWLTGSPMAMRLVEMSSQMKFAYIRATEAISWVDVPRGTGRMADAMAMAAVVLDVVDKVSMAPYDLLCDMEADYQGGKGPADAFMKPMDGQGRFFPAPTLAVVPYNEGLGARAWGALKVFGDIWKNDPSGKYEALVKALIDVGRTIVRCYVIDEQFPLGLANRYAIPYTTSSDPDVVNEGRPLSGNELNAAWPACGVFMYLDLADPTLEDEADIKKAQDIIDTYRANTITDPQTARWWL